MAKDSNGGFWGGALVGLLAGAVVVKMITSRGSNGSRAQLPPRQSLPGPGMSGGNYANGLPIAQSRTGGMAGWETRNGIPTVPLPAESARRTNSLRGNVPPPPAPTSAPQSRNGTAPQNDVYEETFGGSESGMGGESF